MAKIKYKNLLNSFVDGSKAYSLDLRNRIELLFLQYNLGLVEEFMYDRRFNTGTLGTGSSTLVGIPNDIFGRITTDYTQLKNSILTETTLIQTKLNTTSVLAEEKLYVKNILLDTLEEQLTNLTNRIMSMTNSFRAQQRNLTDVADKLNFITNNSYDGRFLTPRGGKVRAYQLTATTDVTTLRTEYNNSIGFLNTYITKNITPTFSRVYTGGSEYLFFSNKICTNDTITFNFNGNYKNQLDKILKYRDGDMYDKLLKIDPEGINGIRYQIYVEFKTLLDDIVISWLGYDMSNMENKITNNLINGYSDLDGNLNNYYRDFNIGYSVVTTGVGPGLVRNNLVSRNVGSNNNDFNFKKLEQLYIS